VCDTKGELRKHASETWETGPDGRPREKVRDEVYAGALGWFDVVEGGKSRYGLPVRLTHAHGVDLACLASALRGLV